MVWSSFDFPAQNNKTRFQFKTKNLIMGGWTTEKKQTLKGSNRFRAEGDATFQG
jgi:hypothetical protein